MPWQLHGSPRRAGGALATPLAIPLVFVAANAVAFGLLRPGVPDLWAARARAAAAADGVGLTYWFGWFGGATPGRYSVITPPLSALVGTEVVAGLAAVAIGAVGGLLLRDTRRPVAAAWTGALCIVVNLWCGRVPFLVGTAFAVATVLFVRRRRKLPAGTLAALTVLASPVAGAFLGLALSGALFAPSTRAHRGAVLAAMGCALGTMAVIAIAFGAPGPEPFPLYLLVEVGVALVLMTFLARHDHLRITLFLSAVVALVLFAVPNGLGANYVRLAVFWLPAGAVALSPVRPRRLALLMAPILVFGGLTSVSAAQSASAPSSQAAYYAALAAKLDTLPDIDNHRLELVHVRHAAYGALLGHAPLARGWETQSDHALHEELHSGSLDSGHYRAWLDENAVGYIAVNGTGTSAEARLIRTGGLTYLQQVWHHDSWRLYRVLQPTPIVASPAVLESSTQATLRVRVPCACRVLLRIRWSRFLTVSASLPPGTSEAAEDAARPVLEDDGSGWTVLTTDRPGTFDLRGAL